MERFAIKSDYFSLYEVIKKEAEKLGWQYNEEFNTFSLKRMDSCDCLWFDADWDLTGAKFAFSNAGSAKAFFLPRDWSEAMEAISGMLAKKDNGAIAVSFGDIAEWKGVDVDKIHIVR